MSTFSQPHQLDVPLILRDQTGADLPVHAVELSFIHADTVLSSCQLLLRVSPEIYQHIDAEALFHLQPELRDSLSGGGFQPETDIEITITLQPQLLAFLTDHCSTPEELGQHLREQSQAHSPVGQPIEDAEELPADVSSPLLQTENWFATEVWQRLEAGDMGYRTFWFYGSPAILTQEIASNGQVSQALKQFAQQSATVDWSAAEAVISDAVDELFQDLENWTEQTAFPAAETVISETVDELTQTLATWLTDSQSVDEANGLTDKPIYQAMLSFFSEDDWPFAKLQGTDTLHMAFQGEHGQWDCYALARDEPAQFIFYSVFPALAEEEKCVAIAEFITRANYGLVPANFELDFDSGEIRLKTCLDATHITIRPAMIRELVYVNVTLMDHYFSGIEAVLSQALSPAAAIVQVEGAIATE